MTKIYRHPTQPTVQVPQLDLLTLLFDSEHCVATDKTVLHVDATNSENNLTKSSLRDLTQRIAHGLRNQHGIGINGANKDVVTVISGGQILIPAVFFGVIAAGGVYSAASPSSTVAELARQVEIGKSRLIICSSEHKDIASKAASQCNVPLQHVLVLQSSPSWKLESLKGNTNAISSKRLVWQRITDPVSLRDSLTTILWSSGTTGLPKGVMLSHLNLVAETHITSLSGREWAMKEMEKGTFVPTEYRALGHLPISHIAGLFGYLILPFYSAGTVYWMKKYNWPDFLKYMKQYKITAFYTVPSIYLRMSKSPEVRDHFSWVSMAATGAAPMDAKLQTSANSKLGDGQTTFIGQTWGLSETTGAVTAVPKGETDVTGSIGSILPGVELRMVDEDYNDIIDPSQPGELLVKSVLVTNGYFNNEQATKDSFHDGWFCTGDIAVMRNGKFYIVDRKKELLKYKGLQVAPAEIENLLFTHPDVGEAAVVGVQAPNDPGTDLPRAYVVKARANSKLTEQEVQQFVENNLADHKRLRGGVQFVDEIPKNAIGKFLRRELRDRAKKEIGSQGAKSKL